MTVDGVLRLSLREPGSHLDRFGNVDDPVGKFWDRICCDAVRVLLGLDCLFCGDAPRASSEERKKVA